MLKRINDVNDIAKGKPIFPKNTSAFLCRRRIAGIMKFNYFRTGQTLYWQIRLLLVSVVNAIDIPI